MKRVIPKHELIVTDDGCIYHLHLRPEMISDTIILVGDPGRVPLISKYFDDIEYKVQNREFVTHTGTYKGRRLSVISTGIGTGNIDIAINELDALVNIDFESRTVKDEKTSLNFVRIGTCGGLQEDVKVDSPVVAEYGIGFDNVFNFYNGRNDVCNHEMEQAFMKHTLESTISPSIFYKMF
jgi:uridine phosphorylase